MSSLPPLAEPSPLGAGESVADIPLATDVSEMDPPDSDPPGPNAPQALRF